MRTTNIILLSFLVTAISFCFIQYSDAQEQVIDKDGYHKITGTKFDEYGFDKDGFDYGGYHKTTDTKFDEYGYDKDGFTRYGWSLDGINKYTLTKFDKDGFDINGFNKYGYNRLGWTRDGINKITGTAFDKHGYNKYGNDKDGFGKHFPAFHADEKKKNSNTRITTIIKDKTYMEKIEQDRETQKIQNFLKDLPRNPVVTRKIPSSSIIENPSPPIIDRSPPSIMKDYPPRVYKAPSHPANDFNHPYYKSPPPSSYYDARPPPSPDKWQHQYTPAPQFPKYMPTPFPRSTPFP